MEELEKIAKTLIWAITEKTLKTLNDKGLLKEPSKLQMLCSSPEMKSLLKKLSSPKYDPCREFKEGDKVRVKREVHGRPVYIGEDAWEPLDSSEIWTVVEEKETGWVHLKNGCLSADVWHGMLELVTPVEELGPFNIYKSDDNEYVILFEETRVSTFPFKGEGYPYYYTQEQAKARAEQERDRLNAEHRKELEK